MNLVRLDERPETMKHISHTTVLGCFQESYRIGCPRLLPTDEWVTCRSLCGRELHMLTWPFSQRNQFQPSYCSNQMLSTQRRLFACLIHGGAR